MKTFFAFRPHYAYDEAIRLQGLLSSEGYSGLLCFEPPETITLGNGANENDDLLVSREFLEAQKVRMLATDRGGKSTYHGPGQLVGFPILNLKKEFGDRRAVKRFTEELLMGLAHACAALGVRSVETRSEFPGLWTSRGKLASIGISVKDGHVFHGFSLNVNSNCLPGFSLIRPCGINNCSMTTLEQEGVRIDSIDDLAARILPYLTVLHGDKIVQDSKTLSYECAYTNLVATVSRSQMAIDHFRTNLEAVANGELEPST